MNKISNQKYSNELTKVIFELNNSDKKHNRVSNILLLRDFFNKLDQCRIKLGQNSNRNLNGNIRKFSNIFLTISADWINELKTQEEFNLDLFERGYKVIGGRAIDDLYLYLYVYWELCKEFDEIKVCDFNPYLSVLKIIERSEMMYVHSGSLNIDLLTFNNLEKYYSYELPSIEDDFLNYIDTLCMKANGQWEIPDQQKTNQLWEEFQKQKNKPDRADLSQQR